MTAEDPDDAELAQADAWVDLRRRFRLAEASLDRDDTPTVLALVDSWPSRRQRSTAGPNSATVGYVKRRAKRVLRGLAQTDADLYAVVAHQMLVTSTAGQFSLDLTRQWLSIDVLFGRSSWLHQSRHGRGRFVERVGSPPRTKREEWLPQVWNHHPQLVRDLFMRSDLPWQVHEAARKMLPDVSAEMSEVDSNTLSAFLSSPCCALVVVAAREVQARVANGLEVHIRAIAEAFFFGSPARRAELGHWLSAAPPDDAGIATQRLCELVVAFLGIPAATRRVDAAIALLVGELSPAVRVEDVLPMATAQDERIEPLIELALMRIDREHVAAWFDALLPLQGSNRWLRLTEALRRHGVDATTARLLVSGESEESRLVGWEVLDSTGVPADVIGRVWSDLLLEEQASAALVTARSSPTALRLLDARSLDLEILDSLYGARPQLVRFLSASLFRILFSGLSREVGLRLVLETPDSEWGELRTIVATLLASDGQANLHGFWLAAFREVRGYNRRRVTERLLEDDAIAATFAALPDASPLLIGAPAVTGHLLVRWAEANSGQLDANPKLLAVLAAHSVTVVSEWGRHRLLARRMTPEIAVELATSGHLEATQLGHRFLSNVEPGSAEELTCMLALLRSQDPMATQLTLEWLEERAGRLPVNLLAASAVDHPDPSVREAVALALSATHDSTGPGTHQFDHAVLTRPKERRRTRELVKQRLRAEGNYLANSDLLEMAQVGARQDAEWAMEELARRAAAGAPVVGFTVVGPIEDS